MKSNTAEKVTIVGGGLGGLVATRVLQQHGVEVVVYEREASRAARSQGGVLDMHQESGLWALQQAGLEEAFRAKALLAGGQDLRILDKVGTVLWEEAGAPDLQGRPEIDRPDLRALLIDSLKPGTIQWDHQLTSIEPADQGYRLTFANGKSVLATTLVGAEGARSRVRPLLTEAQPSYSGVMFVEVSVHDAVNRHPDVAATVGRGSLFALQDNQGILGHRTGAGHVHAYVAMRVPEDGLAARGIHLDQPASAVRAALLTQFAGWATELRRILEVCDDTFVIRPINALPVGVRWEHKARVTMVGDAAHLMSPFAGEGANMAMQDGAALALQLVAKEPAAAIAAFEQEMFVRAAQAAQMSVEGLDTLMAPDGAVAMAAMMRSFAQG